MKRNQNFKFSCQTFLDRLNRKITTLVSNFMHFPVLLGKIAEEESITNQHHLGSHTPEKMNFQAWKSPGEKNT